MRNFANRFSAVIFKIIPDAFSIAIILTFAVFCGAILIERSNPLDLFRWWGDGLWSLLEFTMQIALILVGGYLLAKTRLVDNFLDRSTSTISDPKKAVLVGTLITGVAMWLNWGFGIVVAGVLSRKLMANVEGLKPEIMLASAFSTISVYGVGMSGTIPLLLATEDHFLVEAMGTIPLSQTTFRPSILVTVVVLITGLALFNSVIHPRRIEASPSHRLETQVVHETVTLGGGQTESARPAMPTGSTNPSHPHELEPEITEHLGGNSFANKIDRSPLLGIFIGICAMSHLVLYFLDGGTLQLNTVNTILLFLAVFLFLRPRDFMAHTGEAARTASAVIVQYPLYAGIMGVLAASGLGTTIAVTVANVSTPETMPLLALWTGGIINLLAPSGGGQWALQGPPMVEAAQAINADVVAVALGVASGDMWTNVFHPFWILPALGITGLRLRDVMGHMLINGVLVGVVLSLLFLGMGFGIL